MAEHSEKPPADAPAKPSGKGAPTLEPAHDAALAGALEAFARGDYRSAAEALPAEVADTGDDRAWLRRLRRGLTWEPALWIAAAACGAAWLWAFIAAHPS